MKIRPKKSLGQNFLINKNIIKKIVNLGNLNNKDHILEIGPGLGNLTNEILKKKPKKIFVVEKDINLSNFLKKKFTNEISIFNCDILNFDESILSKNKLTVFGNLPYNIATEILIKWVLSKKNINRFKKLILMFQKEVADRILANHKDKAYGRLSIISNWKLNIKKNFDISENNFFPRPKVESSVLTFEPKKIFIEYKDPRNLEFITRIFFSQRRKMIKKPFARLFNDNIEIINKLKLNLQLRPQNLSSEIYYQLAKKYEELRN